MSDEPSLIRLQTFNNSPPPHLTEPPPRFRPNGLLSHADNVQGTSQNTPRSPTPPPTPSAPEAMPYKPQPQRKEPPALARPTLPMEPKNGPIASHQSSLASPYKGIRDRALGTSAATLQQNLGLVPRLDLRFRTGKYALPKKRPPQSQTTTPRPVSLDSGDPTAAPQEQSTGPLEGRPMSPPSVSIYLSLRINLKIRVSRNRRKHSQ